MTEPTSVPPKPAPAAVQSVQSPWWQQATLWTSAAGSVSAAASLAAALAGVLETSPKAKAGFLVAAGVLTALSAFLGNLGSVFSKRAGVDAAATVLEKLDEHKAETGTGDGF